MNSIEFLVKQINEKIDYIPIDYWDQIREIVLQAKEIHKVEIIEAYAAGSNDRLKNAINTEYYKEKFNNNERIL